MACSLDGFIAGPGDDLSFLDAPAPPDSAPAHPDALQFSALMEQVGAMLMGRRTYDVIAQMEVWGYGETPVLVATHRALKGAPASVRPVTGDIHALVEQAVEVADGKDVYLDGGNIIRQALDAGLVDELCITMVPVLLGGEGVRLFDGLLNTHKLEFVAHHTFDLGMVQLTARPRG